MTKETMLRNYRKFAANDAYYIGIIRGVCVHVCYVEKIMPRWTRLGRASHQNGGKTKLDLYINSADCDRLIAKSCVFTFPVEELYAQNCTNKGLCRESWLWKHFGLEGYEEDRVGFWHDGDITVDGVKYQVKMSTAQIVGEQTLETLKAFKRLNITPPATFPRNITTQVAQLQAEQRNNKKKLNTSSFF